MKQQILLLVELQQVDSEIKRIETRKKELPRELDKLKEDLHLFEERMEEERKKIDDLYKRHRDGENGLKKGNEDLKKIESRLFEVKTNREYQALLKEIDVVNEKNDEKENEIINVLEMIDKASEGLEEREKEVNAFRINQGKKIKKIEAEIDSIDFALLDVKKKNVEIKEKINTDLLKKYDIIRQIRNGRAVVPVWKEICEGCHMNIPPQMYIELQRSEVLMFCPHCNRIICWDNKDNGELEAKG